jgi:guanylate kinase
MSEEQGGLRLPLPDRGALFVVSGPSGVGKSTLIKRVLARLPGLGFSVSATTRAPRPGEIDGKDYHFLSRPEFDLRVGAGAFLEHATVYDQSYGTLSAPVLAAIEAGRSIVLDIDVQGARQIVSKLPEAVTIFVLPPDIGTLAGRLRARGTDETTLERRMSQVDLQLRGAPEFEYVVVNDHLETADAVFEGIFFAELSRTARRRSSVDNVLAGVPARG